MAYWIKVCGEDKNAPGEWIDLAVENNLAQYLWYGIRLYRDEYHVNKARLAILEYIKAHPGFGKPLQRDFPDIKPIDFIRARDDIIWHGMCYVDDGNAYELSETGEIVLEELHELFKDEN